MKKRALTLCLICVMALLMAVPAIATPAAAIEVPVIEQVQEIGERTEETRIYWRTTSLGVLQFRVWSITWGRWLTDWTNF